jgi:hypothetical protein
MGSRVLATLTTAGVATIELFSMRCMTIAYESIALAVGTVKGDRHHEDSSFLNCSTFSVYHILPICTTTGFVLRAKVSCDRLPRRACEYLPRHSSQSGCTLPERKEPETRMDSKQTMQPSKRVTEARAAAQRAKLNAQAETRRLAAQ